MLLILNQLCYNEIFRIEIFSYNLCENFRKDSFFYLIINKKSRKTIQTMVWQNGNCFPKNRKLFENISYFLGNVIIFAAINR